MKNFKLLTILFASICFAAMYSCEGPQGPQGDAGTNGVDGINGTNGTDGTDGVDGNLSCLVCHTQANMDVIETAYETSVHASGSTAPRGTSASCARCHCNEGFQEYVSALPTGQELLGVGVPTRITCVTCHGNHSSLEDDIEAPIRMDGAVTAVVDETIEFDFGGASNLCANCHQARSTYDTYYAIDSINGEAVADGNVAINSTHAGPHHGPQANTINGLGGFGTSSTATHTTIGCVGCHMAESTDVTEGGHTFNPSLEKCVECHADATSFDVNGKQTQFDTRMEAIAQALVTAGALSGNATDGYHPVVGQYPEAVFKGWWNYIVLYEDHSHGVHNPAYFNTLLTTAETNLGL